MGREEGCAWTMSKLYIEFLDDDLIFDENNNLGIESEEDDEEDQSDGLMGFLNALIPIWAYRKPHEDTVEYDVSFDVDKTDIAHVVIVNYTEKDKFDKDNMEYKVAGIFGSRREAKELYKSINDGILSEDSPWDRDDAELLEVQIFAIRIED